MTRVEIVTAARAAYQDAAPVEIVTRAGARLTGHVASVRHGGLLLLARTPDGREERLVWFADIYTIAEVQDGPA